MSEYKDGRGDYYLAAAVREGRIFCHCGHTRAMHNEMGDDCNDEVWDGEGHGYCGCEQWRADPRRTAPAPGSIGT